MKRSLKEETLAKMLMNVENWSGNVLCSLCDFLNSFSFLEIFILHWTSGVVRNYKEKKGQFWSEKEFCRDVRAEYMNWMGWEGEREEGWSCYSCSKKGRWTWPGVRERRQSWKVGQGILTIAKERAGLAVGIMSNDQLYNPKTEVAVREMYRGSYRERRMER